MELPTLVPVEYRGQLVALVSRECVHIIAPWLLERPSGDSELRFVAFMCLYFGEVLNDRLPGPLSSAIAEEWARMALIPNSDLARLDGCSNEQIATALNAPLEQVRHARRGGQDRPAWPSPGSAPSRNHKGR